ncbi:polysaccharide deacetylase family protein [Deinococcus sonorensis]|uniref:Polysaccharide deacetylase family protein n=2 Tax=Deinococcus sonorensis TaxID=309891 RepID=A0AAU7UEI8_9DEIO
MRRRVVGLGVLGAAVYVLLPYLLVQRLGLGLIREGRQRRRELALTFDDGPDPLSTPQVLDALKAAGARATFFVLLPRARAHPELLERIRQEGHQLEPHATLHRHAWLRTPWGAFLEPQRAARQLQQLTGQPPTVYRPPHGAYTLATVLGLRRARLPGAHWSVEGRDWHPASTPDGVRARLLRLIHPGAVVVLHDAGPGARVTLPMLPGLLARLTDRGYRLVPLSVLEGATPLTPAGLPRRLIRLLDRLYDRLGRVRRVADRHDTLVRAALVPFPLPDVALPDGGVLRRGDPVIEFHVNNPLMVDLGVRQTMRQAPQDLRWLAHDLLQDPEWRSARAVFCISALSPLLAQLGFATLPLPPGSERRLSRWAAVLRRAYGSPVLRTPQPRVSLLSLPAFLERYGDPPA